MNKEVKGVRSVERFRKKFEDDPATFMLIDRATKGQTETILFNIDIEAHIGCGLIKGIPVIIEKCNKMFFQFSGDDVFI